MKIRLKPQFFIAVAGNRAVSRIDHEELAFEIGDAKPDSGMFKACLE